MNNQEDHKFESGLLTYLNLLNLVLMKVYELLQNSSVEWAHAHVLLIFYAYAVI